jgi:hypothetical protein
MKRSVLMGCAGLAIAATAMAGPKVPQPSGPARAIQPLAMASFTKDASGKIILTSEWVQVGSNPERGTNTLRYDGAGFVNEFPSVTSQPCLDAGLAATSRYWFGPAANNPHYATDYSMDDGAAASGGTLDKIEYAWAAQDNVDPVGESWPFLLVVQAYSDYPGDPDAECAVPAAFVGGVIFDFGTFAQDGGGYNFTILADLAQFGIELTPNGYIEGIHAEAFDPDTGTITLPGNYDSQPMLWATPEDRSEVGPGVSGAGQWDDDAPLDGIFGEGECYSYAYGVCADPLGACISLYTLGGGCPSADFNGDGFTDFFDYDDYVACFEGAGAPGCNADFNGDGFIDFFDYDAYVFAFEGCL